MNKVIGILAHDYASIGAPRNMPLNMPQTAPVSTQVRFAFYSTDSIRSSALQWRARASIIKYSAWALLMLFRLCSYC